MVSYQPCRRAPATFSGAFARYSLFGYDVSFLNELQTSGEAVEIQPHSDRQGRVVFYTIRFRE